jgi:hypothetical protein
MSDVTPVNPVAMTVFIAFFVLVTVYLVFLPRAGSGAI